MIDMCANFKPLTLDQLKQLNLPAITFDYMDEVYPGYKLPLLFKSNSGLEWREVMFGLVPKWATDLDIAKKLIMLEMRHCYKKRAFMIQCVSANLELYP